MDTFPTGSDVPSTTVERDNDRSGGRQGIGGRLVTTIVFLVVVVILVLFARALAASDQTGSRFAVNEQLGEMNIEREPAPAFQLTTFDGETLALEDLQGQVLMVDFWASWCPPCRQEAPTLDRIYREYQDKGVEFVGIAIWDTEQDAQRYLRQFGITYPNGLDAKGSIAIDYGVTGIPEKYFINRDSILVKKFNGPMNEARLRAVLDELLVR